MPITEDQFKTCQAANPGIEIEILQHDKFPDEVIARVPTMEAYRRFRDLQTEKKYFDAALDIVQTSVLVPDRAGLMKMLDAHPGLVEGWAGELVEMVGALAKGRRKKF